MQKKGENLVGKSKRWLSFFFIVFMISSLFGCQMKTSQPSSSLLSSSKGLKVSGEEKIKIGFSMDTLKEDRWKKDKELFKEAIESLGAEVEVLEANGDDALQILQAETLIRQGVDLLVVVPHNAEAMATIVKKAHSSGVKVLSYDRLIKNADVDLYISFDNEMVGELQATAITELVPKGKYVYIGGADTDNNAHLVKRGVFKVLEPYIQNGDITIVYDQWTKNWDPENAYTNMSEALKANRNDIDAVIAANDATAKSAIKALSEVGLAGEIPVAGQDADLPAIQFIAKGIQTMTVYKPIKALAEEVAEIAIKMAKGEQISVENKVNNGKIEVPTILLPPIAVFEKDIEETIIKDDFHSAQEVYGTKEK